jgi:hypothetical protein
MRDSSVASHDFKGGSYLSSSLSIDHWLCASWRPTSTTYWISGIVWLHQWRLFAVFGLARALVCRHATSSSTMTLLPDAQDTKALLPSMSCRGRMTKGARVTIRASVALAPAPSILCTSYDFTCRPRVLCLQTIAPSVLARMLAAGTAYRSFLPPLANLVTALSSFSAPRLPRASPI